MEGFEPVQGLLLGQFWRVRIFGIRGFFTDWDPVDKSPLNAPPFGSSYFLELVSSKSKTYVRRQTDRRWTANSQIQNDAMRRHVPELV